MRFPILLSLVTVLSTGCLEKPGQSDDTAGVSVDADGDGHAADEDCDDSDASVHPDAEEVCNGVDDNCDGAVDADASDASAWYADGDGDGFGDAADSGVAACEAPSATVGDNTDCDDTDAARSPAGEELCDGIDNDCNTLIDESSATDASTWYADQDGDGFGDPNSSEQGCESPGVGYLSDNTDCDDAAVGVHPGADETCDGIDNNCDGVVDETTATDALTFYADADSDGYGDAATTTLACAAPTGFVADASDCNDAAASVNPGAGELCSTAGVDDDCDGEVDESDAADSTTWYPDMDSDGYGGAANSLASCTAPDWLLPVSTGSITVGEVFGYTPETLSLVEAVSENCTLDDITLDVDISHAWSGDIQLDLVSAAGTSVRIRDSDLSNNAANLVGTFNDDGSGITPDELLSTFDGESIRGDWTLVVTDLVPAWDDGLVNSWELNFSCVGVSVTDDTDCDDYDETAFPGSGCP